MKFDNNEFENEVNNVNGERTVNNENYSNVEGIGSSYETAQDFSKAECENVLNSEAVSESNVNFENRSEAVNENTVNFENRSEAVNENTVSSEITAGNAAVDELSENIKNNCETADMDEVIRKHSDSLVKAAEEIARRNSETEGEKSEDTRTFTPEVKSACENALHDNNVNLNKANEEQGEAQVKNPSNAQRTQQYYYQSAPEARSRAAKAVKKEKKKSRVGKAVGLVASAAVFGLVAGGVMFGVNKAANIYLGDEIASTESNIIIGKDKGDTDYSIKETILSPSSKSGNMDVSDIVDSAMPSVVSIYGKAKVTENGWFGSQSYEQESSGSGIIVGRTDSELLIVTNNHVIEDTDSLEVEFTDGTKAEALVKGGDSDNDVAVVAAKLSDLSEDTLSKISVADIGDSEDLKVGQGVVAIGNALGYGQSVTVGYISALDREIETKEGVTRNLLQTDAAINPGNSGGALLNMQGEVIGINSAKYSDTAVEGMGYAIPISKVKDLIEELSTKEVRTVVDEDKQGYLGIQGKDVDSEMASAYDMPQGIYVYKVVEGGAAADSDLKAKDIITKFDGQSVKSMVDLKKMLTYYESGKTVDLTVQRLDENGDYVEKTVTITLGKREVKEQ